MRLRDEKNSVQFRRVETRWQRRRAFQRHRFFHQRTVEQTDRFARMKSDLRRSVVTRLNGIRRWLIDHGVMFASEHRRRRTGVQQRGGRGDRIDVRAHGDEIVQRRFFHRQMFFSGWKRRRGNASLSVRSQRQRFQSRTFRVVMVGGRGRVVSAMKPNEISDQKRN